MNKDKTNMLKLCKDDEGYFFINTKGRYSQHFSKKNLAWAASLIERGLRWKKAMEAK